MLLEGSCHCQAVRFSCQSRHPQPYQRCYCSICRKTSGAGFLINLAGDAKSLKITGQENTSVYRAMVERDGERQPSGHARHFCRLCGCHLWAINDHWPDLVHPVAGAVDTELPTPPEYVHMMTDENSRASWVAVEGKQGDATFPAYPKESLADWHRSRGLELD